MSTETAAASTTLELTRTIRAPRERVFDAFVDEGLIAQWHCPRGMTVAAASVDARVGGAWRLEMRSREQTAHAVGGVYREIRRPERLVYTWVWEPGSGPLGGVQTLIEVDFVSRDGGTEIRMRHSGFPAAAARDGHAQGWASVFNRLSDLLDPSGTAGTLTLFGDSRSSYTRSARMGLAEKGLAYAHESVPPHCAAVDTIHPFGRIPALRDGKTEIWETSAILRYLDEAFDGPTLNPGMLVDRARTETWVSATSAYLYDTMVRRYVLQYLFPKGEGGQPDRAVIDQAASEMARQLDALEHDYRGRDHLGGGAVSYADLLVTPILSYVALFPEGASLLAERPEIRRAQALMQQRPSFRVTQPKLG
jgi:glutathione S-transferase